MSRRSELVRRKEAAPLEVARRDATPLEAAAPKVLPLHQRATAFIDDWKPVGAATALLLGATYTAYDTIRKIKERELTKKKAQHECDISQNAVYASNEDLQQKIYMNQKAREDARISQLSRLEDLKHPEWDPYSSYPVEQYQEPQQEPQQRRPSEEEVDERLALGSIACASTAILSMEQEQEHAEEAPRWEQKKLTTAAWGIGLVCTGAAIATAVQNKKRDSKLRSAEETRHHRSHRHSSRREREEREHPKSSSRRR
ncbi:hypothetical protein EG329_013076 [Mollisiaceae sp. DMI_Dod_QoI]|nr:hypothetical protein EG329_013076 [Helotiales sp. DMI_Dod_QoI]